MPCFGPACVANGIACENMQKALWVAQASRSICSGTIVCLISSSWSCSVTHEHQEVIRTATSSSSAVVEATKQLRIAFESRRRLTCAWHVWQGSTRPLEFIERCHVLQEARSILFPRFLAAIIIRLEWKLGLSRIDVTYEQFLPRYRRS